MWETNKWEMYLQELEERVEREMRKKKKKEKRLKDFKKHILKENNRGEDV